MAECVYLIQDEGSADYWGTGFKTPDNIILHLSSLLDKGHCYNNASIQAEIWVRFDEFETTATHAERKMSMKGSKETSLKCCSTFFSAGILDLAISSFSN